MTTFYYLMQDGVNVIKDVPFEGADSFEFNLKEFLGWARIWAHQSGEKVIVQHGRFVTAYSTI